MKYIEFKILKAYLDNNQELVIDRVSPFQLMISCKHGNHKRSFKMSDLSFLNMLIELLKFANRNCTSQGGFDFKAPTKTLKSYGIENIEQLNNHDGVTGQLVYKPILNNIIDLLADCETYYGDGIQTTSVAMSATENANYQAHSKFMFKDTNIMTGTQLHQLLKDIQLAKIVDSLDNNEESIFDANVLV